MPSAAFDLLSFTAAAAALTLTPGVDTAMVLRAATIGGPRSGAAAALGIGAGCLVWGAAAATGLTALLSVSELAFTALRWLGAAYLVWLGLKLIARPRTSLPRGEAGAAHQSLAGSFRRALLANLLNPKVGLFYLTFLPQFIPADVHVGLFSMLLAGIHVVLGLLWSAVLIALTVPLGRWLVRPRVVAALDRTTGVIFVVFGVKLALSRPA